MYLLIDLDGTLTDSFVGIGRCINHALSELGQASVPEAALRELVGAPLTEIFSRLLATDDHRLVDRAVTAYRARFNSVGIFENQVFPGIPEALRMFRASGHSLQVVTAKPAVSTRRVVRHFALDEFFEEIHGPALSDRTCKKAELVLTALRAVAADPTQAVMIGDRADDIVAARANGIRGVGAGWGYGSLSELTATRPDYLAQTVADLVKWVQSAS
jgi:phosphoglycolate phosphatase